MEKSYVFVTKMMCGIKWLTKLFLIFVQPAVYKLYTCEGHHTVFVLVPLKLHNNCILTPLFVPNHSPSLPSGAAVV